jgi:hypothetical protein
MSARHSGPVQAAAPSLTTETQVEGRRCPPAMMAVIILMAALVILTGLNFGFLNHLIDFSVRSLLGQVAGG